MSMRYRLCAVLVMLFGPAAAVPALAHHSVSGVFDQGKQITLKGVITKIEWINPHVNFHLDVKDKDGQVTADRKSTRLNSSHIQKSRMPSSA